MPISNLLVNPNPVNSPFHLSGGALILVFSITPSELVVMGHGLRYQKAVSEYSGCNLPALPSTEEQYQKHHANPASHIPEVLSKRDVPSPSPTYAIKTRMQTLFFLLALVSSSNVGDTLCSQQCGQKQKVHQLVPETWIKSNNTPSYDQGQ